MNKESKPNDMLDKYIKNKDIDKLKDILDLSRQKVEELEEIVSKVQEEVLLEAFRNGDKEYIEKIAKEMDEQTVKKDRDIKGKEKKEEDFGIPESNYSRY